MNTKHRPGEYADSSEDDTEGPVMRAAGRSPTRTTPKGSRRAVGHPRRGRHRRAAGSRRAIPDEDDTEGQKVSRRAIPDEDDTEGQQVKPPGDPRRGRHRGPAGQPPGDPRRGRHRGPAGQPLGRSPTRTTPRASSASRSGDPATRTTPRASQASRRAIPDEDDTEGQSGQPPGDPRRGRHRRAEVHGPLIDNSCDASAPAGPRRGAPHDDATWVIETRRHHPGRVIMSR